MDIRATRIGEVVVLSVHGELDAVTAPRLDAAITSGLAGKSAAFIVDLSEVDFLASAGMTVLLKGHLAACSTKRFRVVADGHATSRPMQILGLDRELSLHPTLDAALQGIH